MQGYVPNLKGDLGMILQTIFLAFALVASGISFSQVKQEDRQDLCYEFEGTVIHPGVVSTHDVLGQQPYRLLLPFKGKLPIVELVEEFAGFQCQLRALETFNLQLEAGCMMLEVYWQPGADYSGCVLEVIFPQLENLSSVELFMNY